MYLKKISITLIMLAALTSANVSAADEDGRLWINFNVKGSLPAIEGLGWALEVQPRWREEAKHKDQLLIRPAITYKVSEQATVWLGIGRISNYREEGDNIHENRLWQQLSYKFKPIGDIKLSSRTRFEQRWQDNGDDAAYRLRQTLKVSKPFKSNPNFSVIIADEIFINTNDVDWGARSGIDQNRLFLGGAYQMNKNFKIELGYVNQFVNRRVNQMNHVISANLSFSL